MPPWPGGPCPNCGEVMPENMIHCRNCRSLLNPDLSGDSVEIPTFIPLQEIPTMAELHPAGFFIQCPSCTKELKINKRFIGQNVACNHCAQTFTVDLNHPKVVTVAFYADCPHCSQRLRMATKYAGMRVACKFCQGQIEIIV